MLKNAEYDSISFLFNTNQVYLQQWGSVLETLWQYIAVQDQCICYSMLLGMAGNHYLMNYWPEYYSDVTIAFLDPENVGIDILDSHECQCQCRL